MLIGVDAGALSITDERLRVGVWRVTYNLLKELAKIDRINQYRLYTFSPIDREVMRSFGPRLRNVIVRPTIGWASIQLPIELRLRPVDVFLGLSQMLPFTNAKKIGFIYDLGFLHFPDAYPGSLNKLKVQTRQVVERADQIITISEVSKRDIVAQYGGDNITVAYPGIDARFIPKGAIHKEKNPYILFVGALKRGKNVPFALRVFKKFLELSKKKYDFVIVGGNFWEDPGIRKEIVDRRLEGRVQIKGFVPDSDLPSYYRGAAALLVTSLWEGFCLPAVEALASGCPVVYAKTGSLPEIVGNLGTGYTPGDIDKAVQALLQPKKPHKLHVKYSWSRFARTVIKYYNGLQ